LGQIEKDKAAGVDASEYISSKVGKIVAGIVDVLCSECLFT
jgi:hypothetical protein